MKKNLRKWLSLFAAAVLLVTTLAVSPFFATAEEKGERTYDITLLPTQATAESEGTLQKVEGDYYAFVKDGARVEGTLIWKLPDELRTRIVEAAKEFASTSESQNALEAG